MIKIIPGNLFDLDAEALVNPVNTVGISGKGLALEFKKRFPENYRIYAETCRLNELKTGSILVTKLPDFGRHRFIINFPTKQHWKNPSRMEWIVDGLQDLRKFLVAENVRSVSIPALGAGLGGLDWPSVRYEVEKALEGLDSDVFLFEPFQF